METVALSREPAEERALTSLLHLLHTEYGFDFNAHKRPSVLRRVRRRVTAVGLSSITDYRDFIAQRPSELPKLYDMLLINVTSFFRDPDAWEALADALPSAVTRGGEQPVRVWSAGCSSGEEAYTLAIMLREWLGAEAFARRVQIFATDVDEEVVEIAHRATYRSKALANLPAELVARYFTSSGEVATVVDELRRAIVFGRHDLVGDAPLQHVDILACRNALMYFNPETQHRILHKLHFALNPEGLLMLGKAEMLLSQSDLFSAVDAKMRLFSRAPVERKAPENSEAASLRLELEALQRAGQGELAYVTERLRKTIALLDTTREELFTTTEELAATGEELVAMNEELCRRGGELDRTSVLLSNLLGSLRIGVAVLDRELVVSVWNDRMAALCRRPASEVERRAFFELDVCLPVDEITSAARTCLETGTPSVLTIDDEGERDETIRCVVSIHPLRGAMAPKWPAGVMVLVEEVV